MKKKGVAFLLARRGSKGLSRKNTRLLGGKPLIEWTLDYLCNSPFIERVCVSSNDEDIIQNYTADYSEKILTIRRPEELCGDRATTEDALQHACMTLPAHLTSNHYGVYMQITEPFRPDDILEKCVKKYLHSNHDSVFAATAYHKNFWIDKEGVLERITDGVSHNQPRQIKAPLIREDTGICLVADINLFSQGKRIGDVPGYIFYDHPGSLIDIHTQDDLDVAEILTNCKGL